MNKVIRIGTRGSKLAIAQAELVCGLLKENDPQFQSEIVTVKTKGDLILDKSLDKIGGKGLFVKEIEHALLHNDIDIAVHSMKDMPVEIPKGLTIAAVTKREDPRDVLLSKGNVSFYDLAYGAKIGTSSLRRAAQIKALRPDIEIVPIRGNVLTRINKMNESLDGIVLAAAGLLRINLAHFISYYFGVSEIIPAVSQGVLALETRDNDEVLLQACSMINDSISYQCSFAERAFLKRINGDCHSPVGAFASITDSEMAISGLFEVNGALLRASVSGNAKHYVALGVQLADKLINPEVES